MRLVAGLPAVLLALAVAGCEGEFTQEDLDQARQEGKREGVETGVRYVLNNTGVKPGKNYIVDFQNAREGIRIRGVLPMPLGVAFTCDTLEECSSESSSVQPLSASGGGDDADGDGCHDSYEGACVEPDVEDVDCDGFGPVTVVGEDEYGLDGGPNPGDEPPDGIACELG